MKRALFFVASAFIVLLVSCEGDPGPAGPKGDPGINGNANVQTIIFDQAPSSWTGSIDGYYTSLDVPEVTEDIYSNGAVLVYSLDESSARKSFNALPYTYINTDTAGTHYEYMDYQVYVGEIVPSIKWVDNGLNTTQKPSQVYTFKVVIIQGMNISSLRSKVLLNDYDATMKYLYNLHSINR